MFNGHLGTSQSKKPGEIHRLPVLTGHAIYQRLIGKSTGIFVLLRLFCFATPVMHHFWFILLAGNVCFWPKISNNSAQSTKRHLSFDIQNDLVYFLLPQ
jgi:hypothetical protein